MSVQTSAPVSSTTYRDAVGHHAAGVAVVTSVTADDRPVGMTVSSFASHSVAPPTVSCDLAVTSRSLTAIRSSGRFLVHLLADDQAELAARFAAPDADRFGNHPWRWRDGLPTVPGVLARFDCQLAADVEVGDHAIVLGTVVDVTLEPTRAPLLYQDRAFRRLG